MLADQHLRRRPSMTLGEGVKQLIVSPPSPEADLVLVALLDRRVTRAPPVPAAPAAPRALPVLMVRVHPALAAPRALPNLQAEPAPKERLDLPAQ